MSDIDTKINDKSFKLLEKLVKQMECHDGPWWEDRSSRNGKVVTLDSWSDPLAHEAMVFLYDNKLIIDFDWGKWEEGREFFKDKDPAKYRSLNRAFVLKLLTVVARNDRFNDGAWTRLFDSGDGQKLFKRLLEIETSH